MTTRTRTSECKRSDQRRLSRPLQPWQTALCGLYAALFALVLPLICLGAMAQPGHPHRFPHFVFVDPVLVQANLLTGAAGPPAPGTDTAHHVHVLGAPIDDGPTNVQAHLPSTQTAEQPAGRAVSTLLLFSILAPLLHNAWVIAPIGQMQAVTRHNQPFPESIVLAVPLPPPRTATLLP